MTVEQADAATGLTFVPIGDGARGPSMGRQNRLYVDGDPVSCVVAAGTSTSDPAVTSEKGVGLGDPESKVTATYPDAQPIPETGPFSRPGYLVTLPQGQLAFNITDGVVARIAGGPDPASTHCAG
ncbi:hypothetical protein ACLQ3C_16770 [Gordonia sp. DT30]|uniref:hypothetical protein n=1 Tax=unclassified Gordonia (in: high G+C Gram-positive bacteria) TaxID=2657482 RepID=UPI003CE67B92